MDFDRSIRVREVSNSGEKIVLEDGSVWEIYFIDRVKTSIWLPVATKVIMQSKQRGVYPYTTVLEKEGTGQQVRAKRLK